MEDVGALNSNRCLVVSVNLFRNFSGFDANIISAFVVNENHRLGVFDTASVSDRFVLLEIVVLRHGCQLLRATTASETWKETILDL